MNGATTTQLRAGFVELDITPEPGLRMAMPDAPAGTGVHSPLYVRISLFDDGARRVAIVCVDLMMLEPSTNAEWRAELAAAGGLEPQDVLISCTHTHRAPHTTIYRDIEPYFDYLDSVRERLAPLMTDAVAALRPVELRVGSVRAPGWAFNRRPMYRGGEVGTHGPHWVEDFEGLEGPEDDELQVVVAVPAEGGPPLGGAVAFSCHPTAVQTDPVYSADFPGPLTATLAARHGGVFSFIQGASGDIAPLDMSAPDRARSGIAHAEEMGRALAAAADLAIDDARIVHAPRVRSGLELLEIEQRRPSAEQVRLARWYLEERQDPIDEREFTRRITGHDYTFFANTPDIQRWFARELIGMWEWQRRSAARVPVERVEVQAIAIGDVAFVAYPGEMFVELGLQTKAQSPFATTVICGTANGCHGYVPTRAAFAHGGFETRFFRASRLAEDAGDRLTAAARRVLAELAA